MKAIMMLSGGLDSRLAARLLIAQGIELHALHFTSVFSAGPAEGPTEGERAAAQLGIPVTVEDFTERLIALVQDPPHGHGSGLNPCIDCRIVELRRARELMQELGARFVVTGEVLGQRPMSQHKCALFVVERDAGLLGLVVRPLCALCLDPSIPEKEGWVDRSRLRGFRGRQRTPQIALAKELGITDYPEPAGGCRLTEPGFVRRARDLLAHGELDADNVRLIGVGRQFRLGPRTRLAIGRDEAENAALEGMARPSDCLLVARAFPGPLTLARGELDDEMLRLAARITVRYGKGRDEPSVEVDVSGARACALAVPPATDEELERGRV